VHGGRVKQLAHLTAICGYRRASLRLMRIKRVGLYVSSIIVPLLKIEITTDNRTKVANEIKSEILYTLTE